MTKLSDGFVIRTDKSADLTASCRGTALAPGGRMRISPIRLDGRRRYAWSYRCPGPLRRRNVQQPTSAGVLSEHHLEVLDAMTPQAQAEFLLERAINRYRGANEQIPARADGWRGKITLNQRLNNLFMMALNSDDLAVRAAAIDLDLAALDVEKAVATVDRLEPDARHGEQGPRANALWRIGLLGNRGVAARARVRDPDELDSRRERQRPLLGGRRPRLSRHGRHHRSAALGLPRRSVADDSRARGLLARAVGHAEREAAADSRPVAARLRRRSHAGRPDPLVGVPGAARHHRPDACRARRAAWRDWYVRSLRR